MMRLRLVATLALSTVLLVACGGSEDSPSSGSSAEQISAVDAATGTVVTAADFSFNAPEGWEENDGSSTPAFNFLALAIDPNDDDGFSDNINVLADPTLTQVDSVEELGEAVEDVLNSIADEVSLAEPVSVDGEDAAVVSASLTQGTNSYKTIQYAMVHSGSGYVVTFSFSADRPMDEQRDLAASVMATWSWTS